VNPASGSIPSAHRIESTFNRTDGVILFNKLIFRLSLSATSTMAVQAMCDTVQHMSSIDRSTQQPAKSRLAFTKKSNENVSMNGKNIPQEDHYTHVGVERYQNSNNSLVQERVSTMRKTSYGLMPHGLHGKNGVSPFYIRKVLVSHVIQRTINGLHTVVLTKTQRETMDIAYTTLIKHLQSLRVSVSSVGAHLLIGLLPITAEIDKRALGLFGQICRMPENSMLNRLARRQLSTKSLDSKSWFMHIYKLGIEYGIDIPNALNVGWSKSQWRSHVKNAVTSHIQYLYKIKACSQSSLKWLDLERTSLKKCHIIWPCSLNNNDPILTTAASYRIKLLTLSYILQKNAAKFDKQSSALCLFCSEEDEDVTHFLCTCKVLKKARRGPMNYLFRTLKRQNIEIPQDKSELTSLILNGTSSSAVNNSCSMLCLKLHTERKILFYKMFPERAKKHKKKEVDPQDRCISCNREVKDSQKAIQCELCPLWQHIKCDNIMNGWQYNRIKNNSEAFTWICKPCKRKMLELTDQRIECSKTQTQL